MEDLVEAMTDDNPAMRPTIEQVVEMFEHIHASLSAIKLRSPITSKNDPIPFTVSRYAWQVARTVPYVIHRALHSPIILNLRPSFSVVQCAKQAWRIVRHILSY
jgi:hypothetical protein